MLTVRLSIFVSLCLYLSGTLPTQAQPSSRPLKFRNVVLRQPFGVVYRKRTQSLVNAYSSYDLVFKVPVLTDVSSLLPPSVLLPHAQCQGKFRAFCQSLSETVQISRKLLQDKLSQVQQLQRDISRLFPSYRHSRPSHNKRDAPLGFIGTFSRWAFGTATTEDVNLVWQHVQSLEQSASQSNIAYSSHQKRLLHFMNLTDNRFTDFQEEVHLDHDMILQLNSVLTNTQTSLKAELHNLSDDVQSMISLSMKTFSSYWQLNAFSDMTLSHLRDSLIGLKQLTYGRLSHRLVSPSKLKYALVAVRDRLALTHPFHRVIHDNLQLYYSQHLASFSIHPTHVYVHLRVPIAHVDAIFHLYDVETTPVPVQTYHGQAHSGYTVLTNVNPHFAISVSGNSYLEPTSFDLRACTSDSFILCSHPIPLHELSSPSCTSSLFISHWDHIQDQCHFNVISGRPVPAAAITLQPGSYLISTYISICLCPLYVYPCILLNMPTRNRSTGVYKSTCILILVLCVYYYPGSTLLSSVCTRPFENASQWLPKCPRLDRKLLNHYISKSILAVLVFTQQSYTGVSSCESSPTVNDFSCDPYLPEDQTSSGRAENKC